MDNWIGRSETTDDIVGLNAARRMAALLDRTRPIANRDSIPGHWYQILFSPTDAQSTLALDGHPAKGDFLPPVELPRRMAAGRSITFLSPFTIGETVTRTSTIHSITPKQGRTGAMCFVTVRHRITGEQGQPLLEEDQDIVYRDAIDSGSTPASGHYAFDELLPTADIEESQTFDEAMLFRYSAITFNAHRIHYDLEYARTTEGYPALVVNGSLTMIKLWDMVARHTGRPLISSKARNLLPLFVRGKVALRAAMIASDKALAWAIDDAGRVAAKAELCLGAAA